MKVYQAINSVQAELCKIGIAKDSRNNQGQGYNFRGIDAVYNVLSSIMAQNGLVIVPRMLARTCEERVSKSGGALFYVTVEAEFDLISAEDGSKHTARTFGEAMDSGDKATNKAMSAAYKYMAFQTFAIPTSGDNDADSSTHEVVRKKPSIDNNRLGQAIQKIKEGAYTTDKLRETFALTAEQEKVLVGALSE
jgi:glutamine synthetase